MNMGTEAGQFQIGAGYAIWAAHEAYLKNDADYKQLRSLAQASWAKLPDSANLTKQLDEGILAATGGVRPEIACLLKTPSEETCLAPKIASPPVPGAPTLAPGVPATPIPTKR